MPPVTEDSFEPGRKKFIEAVGTAWQAFLEDKKTISGAGQVAPRDDRLDRVLEEHAQTTLREAIAEAWREYERATNRSPGLSDEVRAT
jgi:hypothetical protein